MTVRFAAHKGKTTRKQKKHPQAGIEKYFTQKVTEMKTVWSDSSDTDDDNEEDINYTEMKTVGSDSSDTDDDNEEDNDVKSMDQ